MSENDSGKNRIPYRSYRIIVASVSSFPFEDLHQVFIREMAEDQLKAFEVTNFFEFIPTKNLRLWYDSDRASPL